MKLARSGSRGVFWRPNLRGTQERRSEGGVRDRGDWWIRWACPYGHLHRARVGPKALAQKRAERNRTERPCPEMEAKPTRTLLADVIDEYLEATRSIKRSWKDDQRYGKAWKARFGGRALEEVKAADLDRLRVQRLETATDGNGTRRAVTPATVNREFAFLRRVYNIAIRDGKVEANPVAKLKALREPSGRVRYLADEEEQQLMKALPTDEGRDRVRILLQTGFRRGEFLGLRWRDVDFKAGVLTVPKSKNGETRHVPMTSTVRSILARRPRSLDGSALVFPNSEGHCDLRWAKKIVPAALRAAKVELFRFHDLRHTFASRLAMEGVELMSIRVLMGHKYMAMTLRYSHLSSEHQRAAIERLVSRRATTQHSVAHAE
jgi:integrase